MTAIKIVVKLDSRLPEIAAKVRRGFERPGATPEIDEMRRQWMAIYSAFVRRRFNTFARGGGDWPPLALATVRARRRGRRPPGGRTSRVRLRDGTEGIVPGAYSILIDTGVLQGALQIGAPGNTAAGVKDGITFGFGGALHRPKGGKGAGTPLSVIAAAHDLGTGRVPKRMILAPPDARTVRSLQAAATDAMRKLIAAHQAGGR